MKTAAIKTPFLLTISTLAIAISTSCQKPVITKRMFYGNVVTLDKDNTLAEAVGMDLQTGKITFIGSKDEAKTLLNNQTEVINYQDNYIYPGFVDTHSHPAMLGAAISGGCLCTPDMTAEQTIAYFNQYIDAHPGKNMYKCYGSYASNKFGNPIYHFTSKMMDEQLHHGKEVPMVIVDYGGHSGCVNSLAAEMLKKQFNVDAKKVKDLKIMDAIELDDNGEIDGNVAETPAYRFYFSIPIELEELKAGILNFQDEVLAKMGYTTLGDCGIQYENIPSAIALSQLGKEGKLKFKVRGYYCIMETDNKSAEEQIKIALDLAEQYNNEYFKIIGIKLFIDGVSEKETCWTSKPYVTNPYPKDYDDYCGINRWSNYWRPIMDDAPGIKELIIEANKNGLSTTIHCFGEAAVHYALDEYEAACKVVKYDRNSIAHCAYVNDEDIARFDELHVAPVVAPHWAMRTAPADIHEKGIYGDFDPAQPNNRSLDKMYKIKSFITGKEGNHVGFHTDGMCADGIPYMLYCAINRIDPDNADPSKEGYIGPRDISECVTPKEALKCVTSDPAYILGDEDSIGTIELNKCADFSIYPVDFTSEETFKLENHEVAHTQLIASYVNGNMVYSNK